MRCELRILRLKSGCRFEDGNAASEPQVGLRQLEADCTAAYDNQVRNGGGVVENRLIREERNFIEPRDRRHHRRRTRSDDKSARTDAMLARLDGALVNESGFGLDHAHTETGEALDRIIGCDLCDNATDMIADALPINAGRDSLDTKAVTGTHDVRTLGLGDQRFRGYTAIVEAVAAHLVLFDQHYAPAQCSASSSYG